ncbi:MAG: hypothetical protein EPO22_14860 [Dehalococcoidia bacterium]|nr:MAG: hypothetical protein EPO22_14860 [Dehalococcoidia bacterium]
MPDEPSSHASDDAPSDEPEARDASGAEEPAWGLAGYDPTPRREGSEGGIRLTPPLLALLIILPMVVAGVVAWFAASLMAPENKSRLSADVANVLNAFSQGSGSAGAIVSRYEGETPPLFPSSIPKYPDASLVSAVMQVTGEDVSYLVIYDTTDSRQKVADYLDKQLGSEPWTIDASQDGRDSDVRQFSDSSDPNLRALYLIAESKQDDRTTIVVSAQVTSGARGLLKQPYSPGGGKPLPDGFPDKVPQYPGSTVIESSFQKQSGTTQFTVSLVTKDDAAKVLDYYRGQLKDGGLTVDGGPSATPEATPSDTSVTFSDDQQTVGGQISVAPFAEDESYTRVDLQVTAKSSQ